MKLTAFSHPLSRIRDEKDVARSGGIVCSASQPNRECGEFVAPRIPAFTYFINRIDNCSFLHDFMSFIDYIIYSLSKYEVIINLLMIS